MVIHLVRETIFALIGLTTFSFKKTEFYLQRCPYRLFRFSKRASLTPRPLRADIMMIHEAKILHMLLAVMFPCQAQLSFDRQRKPIHDWFHGGE